MEKLILDLPPSVNTMFVATSKTRFVHSKKYHDYLDSTSWIVKEYCMKNKIEPIKFYHYIDIEWYLKDVRTDSHNLLKALCDVLERGGMFENDRYILNRTQKVLIDKKNPRVEISLTPY